MHTAAAVTGLGGHDLGLHVGYDIHSGLKVVAPGESAKKQVWGEKEVERIGPLTLSEVSYGATKKYERIPATASLLADYVIRNGRSVMDECYLVRFSDIRAIELRVGCTKYRVLRRQILEKSL